ncbi:hypothetical protein [Blastococcus sp. TF02A-30]|uniref:hypothetical protein n=1 Tax=Blastococcus sp. TF02A-30 TaxID=2250580 RepID=UPI000DEBECC0|nr:hypothetical protein [Blastococcus sp. TF02A-30]RBY89403.1 hypothetical protein DQ241_08015 [Blastococcus sp. TF02A-30]
MAETTATPTARRAHPAHSALVGLASLGVLLQGVWAGLFMGGSDDYGTWVEVHQHGAEATVALAALATIAALVWLRHRTAVVVGTALLFVLALAEMLLGMAIDDASWAVVVHVPLAMLLLALAVWLPTQARRG